MMLFGGYGDLAREYIKILSISMYDIFNLKRFNISDIGIWEWRTMEIEYFRNLEYY